MTFGIQTSELNDISAFRSRTTATPSEITWGCHRITYLVALHIGKDAGLKRGGQGEVAIELNTLPSFRRVVFEGTSPHSLSHVRLYRLRS